MPTLSKSQIEQFITDGYIKLEQAFSPELATTCRDILWQDIPADPHDPSTWTQPVVRLGEYFQEPFRQAASTPQLLEAYDQLAGVGNWLPRMSLGSFPIRFPSKEEPNDTGWHVDASFPGTEPGNYFEWRVNVHSRGRALLMLFLFSDVGEWDAPTRIKVGSHQEVAKVLASYGDAGLSFMELAQQPVVNQSVLPEVLATGAAGTVYLCHPFIVHAAQAHRGRMPKFMAQPPLLASGEFKLQREDNAYNPVEQAILQALKQSNPHA